jgi:hypothetical protein
MAGQFQRVDAGADQRLAQLGLALRRDAGKALAEARIVRIDHHLLPGFGVTQCEQAEVGEFQLQRVEHAHGDDFVALRQLRERLLPAGLADEVGDHEDGRAPLDQAGRRRQQFVQPRRAGLALGRGRLLHAVQKVQDMAAAAARGDHCFHAAPIEHGAHAVAVAGEEAGDHRDELGRDIALAQFARAEIDRGAQVEQEPGRHLAVFGVDAHVRHLHARRDVPVDVPDVVVVLVFAQVREVQAGAAQQRAVVALQQAVEPADDFPFEPAQDLLGPVGRLRRRHRQGRGRLRLRAFHVPAVSPAAGSSP